MKSVWLNLWTMFVEVTWENLRAGDTVYYYMKTAKRSEITDAHGPFVVVDPKTHTLLNKQGVRMKFNKDTVQLLVLPNVSTQIDMEI